MKLLVVNFHYIRDEIYTNGIYPRSPKQFSAQLDVLAKYYNFISQQQLADIITSRKFPAKSYCLITFDDGLKEQMDALDILDKKGVPAVFYVCTNPIKSSNVLDVHKLHYIRSKLDDADLYKILEATIDFSEVIYPDNINELYRYDALETKKIKYLLNFILDEKKKHNVINKLSADLFDEAEYSKQLYMSQADIIKLDRLGYLGTHCDNHLPLATLSDSAIKDDIQGSVNYLQHICGTKQITSISYPYGGPKAVSRNVADIAEGFGFSFGLTMFRGVNQNTDLENPLLLKRIDTNDAPGGKNNSIEFCA
jgi:peptidoglycan/xylan/chitin deacetylase (PgdA/CDA1 family)